MRRRTCLTVALCALTTIAAGSSGQVRADDKSPLTMSPITATFVDTEFATHYTVDAFDLDSKKLTYRWTLELELIDKAGAPNPSLPGSGAAVDLGCDNHGKLTASTDEFIWHHADAPKDNCDHNKMGPSGHQASIVLVVSDGTWACVAEYAGTNNGKSKPAVCKKEDATAPVTIRKAIATVNEAITLEKQALDDLKATPPRLRDAYENTDRGRLKLHEAEDLEVTAGAWSAADTNFDTAWMDDLQLEWNINITNSEHVPKSPLDVDKDQARLEDALKAKEAEVARLQRELRTKH
jgi:hypothetical protein